MYKLISSTVVLRILDICHVSITDAAYLQWLSEGNTPEPADIPPAPVELTPQEKLANAGLSVAELKKLLGIK
jgi:hypothetical protein